MRAKIRGRRRSLIPKRTNSYRCMPSECFSPFRDRKAGMFERWITRREGGCNDDLDERDESAMDKTVSRRKLSKGVVIFLVCSFLILSVLIFSLIPQISLYRNSPAYPPGVLSAVFFSLAGVAAFSTILFFTLSTQRTTKLNITLACLLPMVAVACFIAGYVFQQRAHAAFAAIIQAGSSVAIDDSSAVYLRIGIIGFLVFAVPLAIGIRKLFQRQNNAK